MKRKKINLPPKSVRFLSLIEASGKPEVKLLWENPKKDAELQRQIRQNRVLTIVNRTASGRKEYGIVGFHQQESALYLIFPKALTLENDARVVGIDYSTFSEGSGKTLPRQKAQRKNLKKPVKSYFSVNIKTITSRNKSYRVFAFNEDAAEKIALEQVERSNNARDGELISTEVLSRKKM